MEPLTTTGRPADRAGSPVATSGSPGATTAANGRTTAKGDQAAAKDQAAAEDQAGAAVPLRLATHADLPALLAVFDERVAWLVAQGRDDQWGVEPFSAQPGWIDRVRNRIDTGRMWLATDAVGVLGAIVLNTRHPHYVEAADEPEIYVQGFVTALRPQARGVAAALWRHAEAVAGGEGVRLLRLDCHASPDRRLVRYYEAAGFQVVRELTVLFPGDDEPYHGCLLARRLTD